MLSLNAAGKVLGFDILSSGNVSEICQNIPARYCRNRA